MSPRSFVAYNGGVLKAILFDLDGVLVDSYEAWFDLVNDAASHFGTPRVTRDEFHRGWGQGVDADAGFYPGRTAQEVEAFYLANFRRHTHRIQVNADAGAVFSKLRGRGLKLAVITNTPAPMARDVLAAAKLEPDALVGGTDVPRSKPAPDMVLRACELLGVERARAAVVGDSRYDKEAAGAAGVRFVGYGIQGDPTLSTLSQILSVVDAR